MKTISKFDRLNTKLISSSRLTLALTLFCASLAQAAPVGGVVTSGAASINSAGSTTTINQSTPKAIIQWQGFNVGANESVRFNQPSTGSIALNRVIGPDGSSIMGNLSANGRVFLINPNGILFGAGSQVNVGGMVATTLGMTDSNFLAGNYQLSGNSPASISNLGNLTTNADGGFIALLGANVSNTGVITARLGTIALAAGSGLTLDVAGDRLLNVSVDQGAVNALVSNGHLIIADGGQVLMTARGASSLLSNAVNNTGLIQAQSINNANGSIVLSAGPDAGVVNVSGSLDASGVRAGQTGGSVQLLGGTVNLTNANINVSGDAGGGQALVGGNFNGAGPQPNSIFTNINATSTINADALQTGNGGRIAIWSDNTTVMAGTLTARGGPLSGDGGFIETSGKHLILTNSAYVNTLAPRGKTGMWLLDPINWTIATTGGDETPAQVETSLASSGRTINATNDITVSSATTWSTPQTLILDAGHDININAPITGSTAGAKLNLIAGHDVVIASAPAGALTTNGAGNQINITAVNNIIAPNATFTSGGNISLTAVNGHVDIGTATATTGSVSITAGTYANAGTTTVTTGNVNVTAGTNASVTTATVTTGDVNITAGTDASIGIATITTGNARIIGGNDGTGVGRAIIGSRITATNTTVRFNPATYATTSTEVASYTGKITGTKDVKAWVFLQGNNKVYDQSTVATLRFKGTPTDASAVTLVAGTATFGNKNAGVDKAINYTGYSLGGTSSDLVLYSASGTTTGTITPAPLAVSATGINKVYDATTNATVALSSSPLAGDVVAPSYTAASYLTKSVATGKTVNVSGITLAGADGANYTATSTTASTTASITPAPLVVSATGINKAYDGNTVASVNLSTTPLGSDSVSPSYTAASFSNAYVGGGKPVSVVGIAITGADAGNYQSNSSASTTASITPNGTPSPSNSVGGLEVAPIFPLGASNQAPLALQEDMRNGVSSPSIVPLVGTGIASGSLLALRGSNQSNLLIIADPQKGAELQSLFPAPVIAPIRAPKQGRN